ncbi:MAG: IS1595 family transposase [Burkholderia sp.]
MPINRLQFQAGLSMKEFQEQYGNEAQCEAALVGSRWPDGWVCPRYKGTRYASAYNGRRLWECLSQSCRYQCSSIVGTIFEKTKLPLTTWFLTIYLVTQSKNAISGLELKRQLGVSYKTVWLIKHKLLETMWLREERRRLDEQVEVDDAYMGGERSGGKAGRARPRQDAVCSGRADLRRWPPSVHMRLSPVPGFTKAALEVWAASSLMPTACVVSDGLWCFDGVRQKAASHERHATGGGRQTAQRPPSSAGSTRCSAT